MKSAEFVQRRDQHHVRHGRMHVYADAPFEARPFLLKSGVSVAVCEIERCSTWQSTASFGGCDLVQIKIGDIVSGGQIRTRAIEMQKTGRPVRFEPLPDARTSLLAWLEGRGGTVDDYVFPSRVDHNGHLSTRQYARLVDDWVTGLGLMRSEYGTHPLRRTNASIIYRPTGNLRAVQILLGHRPDVE